MSLRINDQAPNFTAMTTEGEIDFHQWIGDSWAIMFSHPKDFTPVCTTELGYMAKLKPEFDKRNCKIIGLSIDHVDDQGQTVQDDDCNQPIPEEAAERRVIKPSPQPGKHGYPCNVANSQKAYKPLGPEYCHHDHQAEHCGDEHDFGFAGVNVVERDHHVDSHQQAHPSQPGLWQ